MSKAQKSLPGRTKGVKTGLLTQTSSSNERFIPDYELIHISKPASRMLAPYNRVVITIQAV
jgi:hypothetical protein